MPTTGTTNWPATDTFEVPSSPSTTPQNTDGDANRTVLQLLADLGAALEAARVDGRWTNARTPTSHSHAESDVTSLITDLGNKQPLDTDLTAIAALATAAYGRSLLTLADRTALLALLGRPPFASGYHYAPTGYNALANFAYGTGLLTATPLWVPATFTADRIGCEVAVAVASSKVRLGIYADDGNGRPGALILDTGGSTMIDGNSATRQDLTISQALSPGWNWLAAVSQTAAANLRCYAGALEPMGGTTINSMVNPALTGYYTTGVTGALPNPFGTPLDTVQAHAVWLRAT